MDTGCRVSSQIKGIMIWSCWQSGCRRSFLPSWNALPWCCSCITNTVLCHLWQNWISLKVKHYCNWHNTRSYTFRKLLWQGNDISTTCRGKHAEHLCSWTNCWRSCNTSTKRSQRNLPDTFKEQFGITKSQPNISRCCYSINIIAAIISSSNSYY